MRLVTEGESNTVFFAVVSIPCTNQRQQLVTAGTERVAYTFMCLGGEDGGGGGVRMERQTDRKTDLTDRQIETETDRQTERDRDRDNSNSKTLFYKGYSLGSVKTCFATIPC